MRRTAPLSPPLLLLCLILLTTAACAAPEPPQTAVTSKSILYGTPDANPAHRAVVALTYGSMGYSFCSGTLISPRVVLTAAHCVDELDNLGWIRVFFGDDVQQGGSRVQISEAVPHPLYNSETLMYDIGLIRLAGAPPADATPIPILPSALKLTAADDGGPVDWVGFGVTESDTSGVKLTASGTIAKVCDGPSYCYYQSSAMVVPNAFAYSVVQAGPCSGDSGGPAFVTRGGIEYTAGVTSYGDEGCHVYGVSTRPDAYEGWINAFIAGATEVCDASGDEDHDTLADCADPECDTHPNCNPPTCAEPVTVGCGSEIEDTTLGGTYHMRDYSCEGADNMLGPERSYFLNLPKDLEVIVTLWSEGTTNLDLIRLPGFGDGCASWDCLGASLRTDNVPEQFRFTAETDNGYLIVDSKSGAGPYLLRVTCLTSDEDCINGIDDDADGDIDCDDDDCAGYPDCIPPQEICDNGLDEDGDGDVDCDDSDCSLARVCAPTDDNPKKGGCQQAPGFPPIWLGCLFLALLVWRRRTR